MLLFADLSKSGSITSGAPFANANGPTNSFSLDSTVAMTDILQKSQPPDGLSMLRIADGERGLALLLISD